MLPLEAIKGELSYADRIFIDVVNVVVLVARSRSTTSFGSRTFARNRRSYVSARVDGPPLIVLAQALALLPTLAAFGVLRVIREQERLQ